jgi:hypothetical protein
VIVVLIYKPKTGSTVAGLLTVKEKANERFSSLIVVKVSYGQEERTRYRPFFGDRKRETILLSKVEVTV